MFLSRDDNVVYTKLIVDEGEAEQVRQIFELYLEHQAMLPVVTELNRRGWLTKHWITRKGVNRGARPFTKNALHKILTNIVYIGKVRHKENVYEGEHEAIVPEELFARAQTMLERNGRSGGRAVRNKHGALLRGLLRCRPCESAMSHTYTSKGNRRYRYYVCGKARQRGWSECPSPSIPAGEIERFVVEQIKDIGKDPSLITEVTNKVRQHASKETQRLQKERQTLIKQIQSDHERFESLAATTDHAQRIAGFAELHERQDKAKRRLDEIESELVALQADQIDDTEITGVLASFNEVWDNLSPREQSRLVSLLIERVEYDGGQGNVSITFHPTGIRALRDEVATQEHVS